MATDPLDSRAVLHRGVHFHSQESQSLLPHAFVVNDVFYVPTIDR